MNPSSIDQHATNRIIHARDLPSAQRVQTDSAGAENGQLVSPPDEYVSVSGTIELLKMVLEISQSDRKAKKELERAADKAATAAEKTQIEELRAEADAKFTAAVVSGSIAIGASVGSAVGAQMNIRADGLKDGADATTKVGKDALAHSRELSSRAAWISNGSTVMKESAKPIEGGLTHGATGHGLEAKEAEHRASALRRSADSLKSDIDNLRQHDSKLFDLVREVESARNRCTQIALQSR